MMGAERRSMVLTQDQKEKTAYHEAGHAVVGLELPMCDPVYKATIIPRGGALGMVMSLPEMDKLQMFKDEAEQRIAMTMAGKAAEIIKYGAESVSSGPVGDIMQASQLARAMVMRYGMDEALGHAVYEESTPLFLDPQAALATWTPEQAALPEVPWLATIDFMVWQDPREMARQKAAIQLEPSPLSDPEVDAIVQFLHALTGQSARNGLLGIPDAVPSGLPVDHALQQ